MMNKVDIKQYGESEINQIIGEKIYIKKGSLHWLNPLKKVHLNINKIVGDHIYLENTTAQLVQGNHVKVGPNCHIDQIEYQTALHLTKNTIIKNHRMV